MERELTAAQRLQNALLRPVPTIDFGLDITARILSAREVCGDLYDFLSYGTQQLGIALGDVSGKGSAAALLRSRCHRHSSEPLTAQTSTRGTSSPS